MSSTLAEPFPKTLLPALRERPGNDPIFSLNAEATRRAQAGESILNATLGALMEDDGRLAVMPSVSAALNAVSPEKSAAYAPIAGSAPFLAAVIADVFGDSPMAQQCAAVATPGGTGAILHAVTSFLEAGQALLTTSYFWSPYQTIARHTARSVEVFETFDEDGRFHLRAFEKGLAGLLARQGRALVLLNFPCHNPTGYSLDDEEWRQVAEIVERHAARHPVTVLVDFAYAHFGQGDASRWATHFGGVASSAQVLVAWTASKAFAQYGARVGALIAPNPDAGERARIQNALGYACRGTWSNCNHLGQLAITSLLVDPERRAASLRERERLRTLLDERVVAFNAAARTRGLRYPRYEGGFFVTVFTADSEAVAAKMRELGVYVVPIAGAVRIALCATAVSAVPRLVDAVAQGVESVGKRN